MWHARPGNGSVSSACTLRYFEARGGCKEDVWPYLGCVPSAGKEHENNISEHWRTSKFHRKVFIEDNLGRVP